MRAFRVNACDTVLGMEPRKTVPVRFTPPGVAKLDEMRGSWSRSEYIRQAVALAAKQGMKGPEKVKW